MIVAVVVAKVATHSIVERMKRRIANVDAEKSRILNELKVARSKKSVVTANLKKLEMKKAKLKGKISRFRQELKSQKGEAEHRQQVRDATRGKLIRPTRAGPIEEAYYHLPGREYWLPSPCSVGYPLQRSSAESPRLQCQICTPTCRIASSSHFERAVLTACLLAIATPVREWALAHPLRCPLAIAQRQPPNQEK